jgi:hypothetical protein
VAIFGRGRICFYAHDHQGLHLSDRIFTESRLDIRWLGFATWSPFSYKQHGWLRKTFEIWSTCINISNFGFAASGVTKTSLRQHHFVIWIYCVPWGCASFPPELAGFILRRRRWVKPILRPSLTSWAESWDAVQNSQEVDLMCGEEIEQTYASFHSGQDPGVARLAWPRSATTASYSVPEGSFSTHHGAVNVSMAPRKLVCFLANVYAEHQGLPPICKNEMESTNVFRLHGFVCALLDTAELYLYLQLSAPLPKGLEKLCLSGLLPADFLYWYRKLNNSSRWTTGFSLRILHKQASIWRLEGAGVSEYYRHTQPRYLYSDFGTY